MAAEKSNVTATTVRVRYPNLIDYDSDTEVPLLLQMILEAEMDVAEAQFFDLRDRAITALVAHRMTQRKAADSGEGGGAFPVSQATVGSVSMTFLVPPPDGILPTNLHYYTTQAGIEFLEISRRMNSGVRTIGGGGLVSRV